MVPADVGVNTYIGNTNKSDHLKVVSDVDIEEVTAWKNGLFKFSQFDIATVMRSVGRWYDVDVHYEGTISRNKVSGYVRRDSYISDLLKILETSGCHFKVLADKKTIVVIP